MMRPFIGVLCLATLAGCATRQGGRDSQLEQEPMWNATLSPTDGGTVHGTATVYGVGERARVRAVVTLEGSRNGALHPWDIHEGRCGQDGAIVGRAGDYPPIPIAGAGAATMSLEIRGEMRSRGTYYLNVHESPARRRIVACGALVPDRGGVIAQGR